MLDYAATTAIRNPETMPQPIDKRWLTVEETCAALGVSRSSLFRMMGDGRLDSVKQYRPTSRKLYFWAPDVESWLEAHTGPGKRGKKEESAE